jgi:hypothetical protein
LETNIRWLRVLGYIAAVAALCDAIFEVALNGTYSEHVRVSLAADAVLGVIGGAAVLIGNALQNISERLKVVEGDTKRQ